MITKQSLRSMSYYCEETKTARIQAGTIRGMGFNIDENIPDLAHVNVESIVIIEQKTIDADSSKLILNIALEFTEEFEWAEIDITIPNKEENE